MRKGSTSFGACEVRWWRWLFGNTIPISLGASAVVRGWGVVWGGWVGGVGGRVGGRPTSIVDVVIMLLYMGTSLIRKRAPLGSYSRHMPRAVRLPTAGLDGLFT